MIQQNSLSVDDNIYIYICKGFLYIYVHICITYKTFLYIYMYIYIQSLLKKNVYTLQERKTSV